MKMLKKSLFALFLIPFLQNCADYSEHSVEPVEAGTADFSKYVAVGNSLAAGFQSNALYPDGQAYSYPNLLAQQLRVAEFALPEIGQGYGDRIEISDFSNPLAPVTTTTTLVPGVTPTQPTGGYQNLGIPGAVLSDFLGSTKTDALGGTTTYTSRFAASPAYAFVLGTTPTPIKTYFAAQNPTFATFWLGNNDILGYVTSGGLRAFTSPAEFQTEFTAAITALLGTNSKAAVANIPGVTSIPFATYVGPKFQALLNSKSIPGIAVQKSFYPANPAVNMAENRSPAGSVPTAYLSMPDSAMVLLTSQTALTWLGASDAVPADADKVKAIVAYWKGFLVTAGAVANKATADAMTNAQVEQTLSGVTYTQYSQTFGGTPQEAAVALGGYAFDFTKPFGLDASNPFPNQFILDKNEINIAKAVTNMYNSVIAGVVGSQPTKLALVNMNTIFSGIVSAGYIVVDGITLAPALGSLFSFDGVHPTNQGHAVLANEFIKAINSKFGSSIALIDVSRIPTGVPMTNNPG